jgi:phytoene dehydrogenase-like protein
MAELHDAIVVGAGHNGLTCAAYVARAGRKVLVLERRAVLGGATVSESPHPGFTFSSCSYVVSLLRPQIIRDLELSRHGLEILPLDWTYSPFEDGTALLRGPDPEANRREIARFSPRDADRYALFGQAMGELGRLVKPLIEAPAPEPDRLGPRALRELWRLARRFRGLDDDALAAIFKMMTTSAADFLAEWFESERLIGPMSVSGIIGTFLGPRSPGTAYVLLHHYMGEIDGSFRAWGLQKGGTGGVALAIARSARAFGAEIRTSSPVARILIRGGEARGVVLENGEEHLARAVISGADPHRTFLGMVGEEWLDAGFARQIRRFKLRGSSGKVNLALDALPEVAGRGYDSPALRGDITISPSVDYLERAYDDAKYGRFSRRPCLDCVIPSLTDPSVAPPGKHVMSIFVQYAPYRLREGPADWESQREAFGDAVIDTLERFLPGIRDRIVYRQVLTPWDLEQTYGLSEGNIFHGELRLEQLAFLRPVAGFARYRTPIRRLWLCGSGTHPGGGIMATPGQLCAKALLEARAL